MKRTMIISVFAGCGKTWLAQNQEQYNYTIRDSDSSTYAKVKGWESAYVKDVVEQANTGQYDFIFICQTEAVINEMDKEYIKYTVVEPDNIVWNEYETKERARQRQLIKQQWIGRLVLRDNSHIADFPKWLRHINQIYDDRTGFEFFNKHNQVSLHTLDQNQYLSDIIDDLYWKKEHYDMYVANVNSLK